MFRPPFIFRSIFPGIYGLLVIASIVFAVANRHDAFSLLPSGLITMPWFVLFAFLFDFITARIFPPHFIATTHFLDSQIPGILLVLLGALINGFILYLIGYAFDYGKIKNEHENKNA